MCGLVGVVGAIGIKEEKAFKTLLELDTTRGPHSTGVYTVGANGKDNLVKSLGTPWDMFDTKQFKDAFFGILKLCIGHNRWATTGAIIRHNAHPFRCKHIVGAHNGTLVNQTLLDDHKFYDVDSENIFSHMAENGLDHTLLRLHGAYALTWYNTKDSTFNVIRNKDRPLTYVFTTDNRTMFWASEAWMLTVALSKAGIEFQKAVDFTELSHYEFNLTKPGLADNLTITPNKEVYIPPVPKFPAGNYAGSYQSQGQYYQQEERQKSTEVTPNLAVYMQKELTFKVIRHVTSIHGTSVGRPFAECAMLDGDGETDIVIRVYKNFPKSDVFEKFKVGSTFSAFPSSFCYLEGGYLTVFEKDAKPANTEETYIIDKKSVSKKDAKLILGMGCSICAEKWDLKDIKNLVFFDSDYYICPDCMEDDYAKQLVTVN